MMKRTYVGIIQNELCDIKTLVLAESAEAARARILDNFRAGLGKTYREEDLRIIAFADPCRSAA